MQCDQASLLEVAKKLGRYLLPRVPHVVGVSLLPGDPDHPGLQLYVDISVDAKAIPKGIPKKYCGYVVHTRRVGQPSFLQNDRYPLSRDLPNYVLPRPA
jgi:hypothetical protein